MQTVTLKTHTDKHGMIRLEIPTQLANQDVEIVVIMQPFSTDGVDAMGYPIGYFEETYGSFADAPMERQQPLHFDTRDPLE